MCFLLMLIESFAHLHFCNCVFPPAQGLTDYSLQAKFNPFPVFFFFNKVLLIHISMHLFNVFIAYDCFSDGVAEWTSCSRD